MRGAVRLAALMGLPSTFVWTHDSIGLGEDGPTHQPIEHLASLRLMPNLSVVRPCDGNETAAAWSEILRRAVPAGLALSRQDLPVVTTSAQAMAGVAKGGYALNDVSSPDAIVIATGSEVEIALAAATALEIEGVKVRVVSMPCVEWFESEDAEYRESVLPAGVFTVAIEAGVTASWYKFAEKVIGIDHFGASADPKLLFKEYGITSDSVVAAIKNR
jgi:transketolase